MLLIVSRWHPTIHNAGRKSASGMVSWLDSFDVLGDESGHTTEPLCVYMV